MTKPSYELQCTACGLSHVTTRPKATRCKECIDLGNRAPKKRKEIEKPTYELQCTACDKIHVTTRPKATRCKECIDDGVAAPKKPAEIDPWEQLKLSQENAEAKSLKRWKTKQKHIRAAIKARGKANRVPNPSGPRTFQMLGTAHPDCIQRLEGTSSIERERLADQFVLLGLNDLPERIH